MISAPKESILRAGLDASEYTRGAAEIDRANADMASSAAAVERANQSGAAALAAFEETEKRSARAKRELAQSQKVIAAALQQGVITEAQADIQRTAAQEKYERALMQTSEQQRRSTETQERMTRSIVSSASTFDRLEASLDKNVAAQRRYEQVVDRVNAAVARDGSLRERGNALIAIAEQRYLAAATATEGASRGFRSVGFVAQQAGFQVQDFAVQVASGQSALVAFAQQAPQFLGVFGTFGALAGAAVAIGAVTLQMMGFGKEAKTTAESAKIATDEIGSLTEAIKKLNEESAKRGGGQPGIRANVMLEDLMAERRRLVGMLPAGSAVAGATDEMTAFIEAQSAAEIARIQGQIDAIDKLIREYDRLVTEQERVDESTAVLKRRGEEFEEQKKREAEAIREAARAQEEAERIRQRFLSDVTSLENVLDPATAATRRWADQQALLLQALDASVISQERYNELVAASDELFRKATEKNVEYLTGIEKQTRENDNLARELGFTFQSAFEDAILRGEKLRGVLGGIAQDLARIVLRRTVTERLAGFADQGIKSAGSWLAGLLGGGGTMAAPNAPWLGLPGFADGGPVSGGRPIVVGEEGPEIFVPSSAGQIIPNGQSMGGTVVHQTINISVGVAQTVRAELAALMPAIKRQTVDAVADARMRGGSFAAAMGT